MAMQQKEKDQHYVYEVHEKNLLNVVHVQSCIW